MRKRWIAIGLAIGMVPASVWAQPVELPTTPANDGLAGHGVLLPPISDVPVKGPNNIRERYGEFSISGGVYLIAPVFTSNPAFVVSNLAGTTTRTVEFNSQLEACPDIWIGYASERGWGVRGRWFQFDHDANARYAVLPGETIRGITPLPIGQSPVAGAVKATSNLGVDIGELQVTRNVGNERWTHMFGVGLRYIHMSQDYSASLTSPARQINLTSGHSIYAWGPSLAWDAKRSLGDSGFAIYGQTNIAVVFGHGNESAIAINNGVRNRTAASYNDVLPIGELEVGVEYQRDVGDAKLFVQTGFVGQVWWGGGNASNVYSPAFSSAADSNFGFLGLIMRAGVRY